MTMDNHYDVIIIGTGAGGGTLAYHLAPSGKRILLLERGGYLPREKDNWESRAVFVESKYRAKETWYDKDGKPFYPGIQYYVGGNTKVYGAALLRFRKEDFGEVRHHGGISPAWPLSYEDFEPYYTKAEHLYHVHGQRGVDPTEGPASAPYRYPPVSHEPRIQELFDDFRRLGHHPFPLPLGILLDEAEGKALHTSACVRCAAFDGFPCLVNGKADAQVICVDPALEHSNVELLTGAYVERLETDPSGRVVTKVIVTRKGARRSTPRISSWSPAGRSIPRRCFCAPLTRSTPPGWPTAPMWSAGTTCVTTAPPSWPFPRIPIPRCSRRLSR
jgi:choline dehydrogenase-like flavoprotein